MGIKHLTEIEKILISADKPMTLWQIQQKYSKNKGTALHRKIVLESIGYLKTKKKIKEVQIDKHYETVKGYKWVG